MATRTRSSDPRRSILPVLPGPEHLKITGARLPTYQLTLLCFMANLSEQLEQVKSGKQKVTRFCANNVIDEVNNHYNKARIPTIAAHKMAEKVEALYNEFKWLMKLNPERRMDSVKVKEFQEKLSMTMPFWPRDVMKQMEDSKKRKSSYETVAIEVDMTFLSSMMTDRVALYEGNYIKTSNYEEMRQTRKEQQEERQFKEENRKMESWKPVQ